MSSPAPSEPVPGGGIVAAFACPACGNAMKAKVSKPGKFGAPCKKCGQNIQFSVSPGDPPKVTAQVFTPGLNATTAMPVGNQTVDHTTTSKPNLDATMPSSAGATAIDATIAHQSSANVKTNATNIDATIAHQSSAGANTSNIDATIAHQSTAQQKAVKPATKPPAGDDTGGFSIDLDAIDGTGSISDYPEPMDQEDAPKVTVTLGGYKVVKKLGEGGMGDVYLANQLSLDRRVAVKTMKPAWAKDKRFLARFTREAYAAAQLVHHNIVQIYDIGEDRGTHFFSMEFVEGQSLQDLLEKSANQQKGDGRLKPDEAVGLILQAARGLKLAHDMGMIHRDIKPANLMLNRHGIVKVADLGLVKIKGLDEISSDSIDLPPTEHSIEAQSSRIREFSAALTQVNAAMGTPKYMAPEQAADAAHVDVRADIYSLGCTLYEMVTGRPPFDGKTIYELMSKHAFEPVTPPDTIVSGLPKRISAIIQKMVAKKPEERYRNASDLIVDLEDYLQQNQGPFRPNDQHVETLEKAAEEFNNAPLAKVRGLAKAGFFALCLILALVTLLTKSFVWGIGFLSMGVIAALVGFLISGIQERTYVFSKVREFLFTSSWTDWLTVFIGVIAFFTGIYVFGLIFCAIVCGALGVGAAFGYYYGIERRLWDQRAGALGDIEDMLKHFRIRGMDEKAIQAFVRDFSGNHWEELFEALFGYQAKLAARDEAKLGPGGRARPKFGVWRDRLIARIDEIQKQRKDVKERKHLLKVEEERAREEGKDIYEARREAERAASQLVAAAAQVRKQAALGRKVERNLFANVENTRGHVVTDDDAEPKPSFIARIATGLLGPRMRFIVGALLLMGCVLWLKQNQLIPGLEQIKAQAQTTAEQAQGEQGIQDKAKAVLGFFDWIGKAFQAKAGGSKPLELPSVPGAITGFFDSLNSGVAGLILIISALFGGVRMTFFAVPAALIAFVGHKFGIPDLGGFQAQWATMGVGALVFVAGFFFGRSKT